MTKPSLSCYLFLIVCLRGSCHPSFHPSSILSLRHLSSVARDAHISAVSLNNAAPHAVKGAVCPLSCTPHCMQSPSLLPFFLLCCSRSDSFPLSSLRLLHLTFAYGWVGACQAYVLCWQHASEFAYYVCWILLTNRKCKMRRAVFSRVLKCKCDNRTTGNTSLHNMLSKWWSILHRSKQYSITAHGRLIAYYPIQCTSCCMYLYEYVPLEKQWRNAHFPSLSLPILFYLSTSLTSSILFFAHGRVGTMLSWTAVLLSLGLLSPHFACVFIEMSLA